MHVQVPIFLSKLLQIQKLFLLRHLEKNKYFKFLKMLSMGPHLHWIPHNEIKITKDDFQKNCKHFDGIILYFVKFREN